MIRFALLFIAALSMINCTRPGLEKSKLTIAFPNGVIRSQSAADSMLSHIVVNITIPGQTPIFYSWDMDEQMNNIGTPDAPNDVSFEISSGSGRMIQVLYVFKQNETQTFDLQYGDQTVNVSGSQVIVEVPLVSASDAPNVIGRISGRYFSSATTGPTGDVEIRYSPLGKPAMVIEKEKIFGGWFSFFALSDINLDYVITSGPDAGKKIFNQSVSLQSNYFKNSNNLTYPQNILKGAVPLSYKSDLEDPVNINEAKLFLWGWFSDNSAAANIAISGRKICPDLTNGQASPYYRFNPFAPLPIHDTNLNNSFPTTAQMLAQTSSWDVIEYFGGLRNCSGSLTELETKLTVNSDFFMDAHASNLFPYLGALKMLPVTGGSDILVDVVGNPDLKRAQLLPGLGGLVQKIDFFVYSEENPNFSKLEPMQQDKFPCESVPGHNAHLSVTNPSETPFEFSVSALDSIMSTPGLKIIGMCFRNSSNQNVGPGIIYWPSNTGVGNQNPYLRIEVQGASPIQSGNISIFNLTTNVCYPVEPKFYLYDGVTQPVPEWPLPVGGSVTLSGSSLLTSGFIYKDATCTTAVAVNDTFELTGTGPFTGQLYFKSSTSRTNEALSVSFTKSGITETIDADVNTSQIFNFNTPAACSASSTPGDTCTEGTIYLGSLSPGATDGGAVTDHYMTTPGGCGDVTTVAGGTGSSTYTLSDFTPTCSGTDSVAKTWNDGSTVYYNIPEITDYNGTDAQYGSTNTTTIATITDSGTQGGYHAAARYCDKLVYGGHTDWYLPNNTELALFTHSNIPGVERTGWFYWSSSENDLQFVKSMRFSDNFAAQTSKEQSILVRCVRRF